MESWATLRTYMGALHECGSRCGFSGGVWLNLVSARCT